ncbi:MAG: radical SAM protein [Proteobacteria bacterium]|nr:radical SAM protein [Pseudomonadota bacterium]
MNDLPDSLRIYHALPNTRTLGPDLRFAIWVQGCRRSCEGCMSPSARALDGGKVLPVSLLADTILNTPDIEGISISGGEPFLQAQALTLLLRKVKQQRDLGIIVYTGFMIQELQDPCASGKYHRRLLREIDLLIDGPYVEDLNDGLSLRGSSNQQVHALTDRYAAVMDQSYGIAKREVELHQLRDRALIVGIPGKEFHTRWKSGMSRPRNREPQPYSRASQ